MRTVVAVHPEEDRLLAESRPGLLLRLRLLLLGPLFGCWLLLAAVAFLLGHGIRILLGVGVDRITLLGLDQRLRWVILFFLSAALLISPCPLAGRH